MLQFAVDDMQVTSGCQACCCEQLQLKPGTITPMTVSYVSWAVPIGQLHCEPRFQLEQMDTCPAPAGGNLPPAITALDGMVRFDTGANIHLDGDLRTKITDPEGLALTFKPLPLYGPQHGLLKLDPTGLFDYDPAFNYKGEERFFVSASDGFNQAIFEVLIAIGIDAGLMTPSPVIRINPKQVKVNQRHYTVTFPIEVSPAALTCDVWRLTVLQSAIDCDCTSYVRTDCYDIKVVRC
jgi:hypothetical protein